MKLRRSIACAMKHCDAHEPATATKIVREVKEYLDGRGKDTAETDAIRQATVHVLREDSLGKTAEMYELESLHIMDLKIRGVVKRGGEKQDFHPHKLFKSIKKAFDYSGIEGGKIAETLTKRIAVLLNKEYAGHVVPSKIIRKLTAQTLLEEGYKNAERSYLLHKYL